MARPVTGNRFPEKWQWLGHWAIDWSKSSNRLVNEKRQSIGKKDPIARWLFWPNEPKSSHVIIGNIVFIIHAKIAGITKLPHMGKHHLNRCGNLLSQLQCSRELVEDVLGHLDQ